MRKELECVRLGTDFPDNDAQIIPAGSVGTIVHVFAAGAYLVEFAKPFEAVVVLVGDKDITDDESV